MQTKTDVSHMASLKADAKEAMSTRWFGHMKYWVDCSVICSFLHSNLLKWRQTTRGNLIVSIIYLYMIATKSENESQGHFCLRILPNIFSRCQMIIILNLVMARWKKARFGSACL